MTINNSNWKNTKRSFLKTENIEFSSAGRSRDINNKTIYTISFYKRDENDVITNHIFLKMDEEELKRIFNNIKSLI